MPAPLEEEEEAELPPVPPGLAEDVHPRALTLAASTNDNAEVAAMNA